MPKLAIAANEVHDAVRASLYDDDAGDIPADEPIIAPGIMRTFAFQPDRLERQRPKVVKWLQALPHEFRVGDGEGGWTFLNACLLSDGTQWTGEHMVMEELFCLAVGLRLALMLGHRDVWPDLPGGMPYYVIFVDDNGEVEKHRLLGALISVHRAALRGRRSR